MIKRNSCETCSFLIIDEDITHLSRAEQIEFEKINTKSLNSIDNDSIERLAFLLQKIRKKYCIGGLINNDVIKANCKYHINSLSADFDNTQLLQVFNINRDSFKSKKANWIAISLGVLTFILSFYSISIDSKNQYLEKQLMEYKKESKVLDNSITTLKDSIINLNNTIKEEKNE
jgi:hypothetical protein